MTKLFTYGTLKQGFINEPLLGAEKFLCKAVIPDPRWRLYEVLGNYHFPALVEHEHGYIIYGELYEIVSEGCLTMLDRLEGVSAGLYSRTLVQVLTEDGRLVEDVVTYKFMQSLHNTTHIGSVWPKDELPRWRLLGTKIKKVIESNTEDVVRLWNKRHDAWHTPGFVEKEDLIKYLATRYKVFGGKNGVESFNPKYFEVRDTTQTTDKEFLQITGRNQEGVEKVSPLCKTFEQIAEWAQENITFFGRECGTLSNWKSILTEQIVNG